jgi:hypothetical protein
MLQLKHKLRGAWIEQASKQKSTLWGNQEATVMVQLDTSDHLQQCEQEGTA